MTFKVPSRCGHCGRQLKNGGQIVLGLELGSECVNKFAGLAAYLEQHDITIGQTYPTVPDEKFEFFKFNPDLIELKFRAALAGVRLEVQRTNGGHPFDTVIGIKSADPARFASAAETRTTFETSLERAS
jgi:hypothetical protein